MESGFVSTETITETAKSSLVVTAQFSEYSTSNINVGSNFVRYGVGSFLPNIGLASDSAFTTQLSCTDTLTNNYHRKNIKIFR